MADLTPYVPWIWFWFFAALTVAGALGVVLHHKIVYNAVFLALSLIGTAALFVTLNADFLGIVQLLLYVGGVIILLLFGILLTRGAEKGPQYVNRNRQSLPAALGVLALSGWMAWSFWNVEWPNANHNPVATCSPIVGPDGALAADLDEQRFACRGITPNENISVSWKPQVLNRTMGIEKLGRALMKPYILIFELASLILLVAMVGVVLYMKGVKPLSEEGDG